MCEMLQQSKKLHKLQKVHQKYIACNLHGCRLFVMSVYVMYFFIGDS